MSRIVGTKGQIVIEKSIRDTLGLQPGYIAVQKIVGDHVEIYFFPPEHERSLRGILAGEAKTQLSLEQWDKAKEKAWSDAAQSDPDVQL